MLIIGQNLETRTHLLIIDLLFFQKILMGFAVMKLNWKIIVKC